MLDLNFVRDNLSFVEEKQQQRGLDTADVLKDFRELDTERRQAITEAETLKARRNRASEEIAKLKKSGEDATALIAETKEFRERIQQKEKAAAEYETRLHQMLAGIPNVPHDSVPVGKTPEDNVEVRRWGTPPNFDFRPKPHWEIGERLGMLDFERAAKLSGARFAVYWEMGAKLERALANFMLELHTREHGYSEVLPPYLVNSDSMYATGQLPKFASDLFRVPHGEKELQKLGLHYRVVTLCTGDMGFASAKTYDLEVWLPGQQLFREISSCSNFESFQARRGNIRYRPEGRSKTDFVHTLNGSGLAIGRTWVALVENYQNPDGSVVIPEILQPYLGSNRITPREL